MAETTIEWTATRLPDGTVLPGYSFNPWTGCTRVSPACDHCYAAEQAKRNTRTFGSWEPGAPRKRTSPDYWRQPYKWDREAARTGIRRRVFCASMADVFDNQVDPAWRADLLDLVRVTPALDWLLLTKRPQNILKMLREAAAIAADRGEVGLLDWLGGWLGGAAPANVWLGTTVEDQERADRRIPHLLAVPAVVRFLSCEPLLEVVDLSLWIGTWPEEDRAKPRTEWDMVPYNAGIHWVIAGGESGGGARPSCGAWFRDLRDQCAAAAVPFLFKQHGDWINVRDLRRLPNSGGPGFGAYDHKPFDMEHQALRIGKKLAGRLLDGVLHDGMPAPHPDTARTGVA